MSAGALACSGGGTPPPPSIPAISLSSSAAAFSATAGSAGPAAQSITITNSGTGTLGGLTTGTIVYGSGQVAGWLSASMNGATAPATLTLTPSINGLLAGTYTASVPITSSATGVANSPQSVSLTMTVAPGQPARLAFAAVSTATAGGVITPPVTISIDDAIGELATSATTSVTIALGANGAGAVLSGTTTVAAVAGVATFSNLTVSKPGAGFTLVASAAGLTGATSAAFTVASSSAANVTLAAAGQDTVFLASPNFAAKLAVQPGSQYLVAVVNTDASYVLTEGFSLAGSFGTSAATSAAAQRIAVAPAVPRAQASMAPQPSYAVTGALPPSMAALGAAAKNHASVLEENRQIFARLGNPSTAWARARAQEAGRAAPLSAALVPVSQTVGTVNKVYVRNSLGGTCTTVDSIGARTVAVGQHVIVLADTNTSTGIYAWPNSLRPDSAWYQTFANEFDQVTYPHILANIGNPVAYDASLSHIGKITVTITAVLNHFAGAGNGASIVAFVNGCDFYPYVASGANAALSNQTEMFYSWVPSGQNGWTPAAWEAELRATAAHETKHIVSYTDRIINNGLSSMEEIWLEEGLAQESSEIWERNYNSAIFLGNAGFLQTVACEINLGGGAPCANSNTDGTGAKPYALLGGHLPFFFSYLQSESTSNGEGLGLDVYANYGAGWTIARWATDQYANGSEATFIKSLINDPSLSGLNNLAAHTGQSIQSLLVYWNLATAIFQTPAYVAADVRITIPSFNFADIFNTAQTKLTCSGVKCGLFTSSGNPVYPIQPIAVSASGSFNQTVNSVPGTSASFFLLTAPNAGFESLQLLTPSGAALSASSGFRVAIVRVQ